MTTMEQTVKKKGGVGCLGGDARDPTDMDVRALAAAEEVEVAVHHLFAGERQTERKLALHLVHEQRPLVLFAGYDPHRISGYGWIVVFRIKPGHLHMRGNRQLDRQATLCFHDIGVKG